MPRPKPAMLVGGAVLAIAAGMAVAAADPQAADVAEPADSWTTLLQLQLKEDYNCHVDKILYSRHVPIGNDIGTEGRVRCLDRREYEFTRRRQHQKFTIRLCQPTVC